MIVILILFIGFQMVTTDHFALGSALLYKTGLASQWGVAQLIAAADGRLKISSRSGAGVFTFHPESTDILPITLFADPEISVYINSGK